MLTAISVPIFQFKMLQYIKLFSNWDGKEWDGIIVASKRSNVCAVGCSYADCTGSGKVCRVEEQPTILMALEVMRYVARFHSATSLGLLRNFWLLNR